MYEYLVKSQIWCSQEASKHLVFKRVSSAGGTL